MMTPISLRPAPLGKRRVLVALSALFAAAGAFAQEELPPLPHPATSFGAAIAEGWLYVYGGNTGKAHEFHRDCIKGDFFRLQLPDGRSWEALGADAPLLGAAMASHEGWVYRIGGMEARNAKGEKNDLHSTALAARYRPDRKQWEALPPLPEPRSSHDVAVLGDRLYAAGGWKLGAGEKDNKGEWHSTYLTLDLHAIDNGWRSSPQPFQRRALAAVAHGGRIWFLGGMGADNEPSREVDWLDPKTGEWGKGPELPDGPMEGFGMAACSAGGRLLASPLSGVVYALSDDGREWKEAATLKRPRFFHRLLPGADGRVIAVGGSTRKEQVLEPEWINLGGGSASETAAAAPSGTPAEPAPAEKAASAAPWPQWRGPNRDGVSAETAWSADWPAEGPRLLWRAQAGLGMSSCVVADGRVVTQGNDGNGNDAVLAFDAASGAELWRYVFPCKSAAHEMPIVPNGPGATPTIVGGRVYALSREGDLLCLGARDGALIWRRQLISDFGGKRPVYGYAQSPLVADGRVFLDVGCAPDQTGSTVALDAANGETVWRAGKGEAGYSSARMLERDGRRYVAMFKGEALDLFDPADGHVLWSHRTTARDFCNALTPVFVDGRILVSNTGDPMAKLLEWNPGEPAEVREVWANQQFAMLFNNPILHDGCLFGFNEKRRGRSEFACLDAKTGETKWVSDRAPIGTFILAGGRWIFLTREGEAVTAPATAAGLEPTARFKALEGKCYATPALADGRLYVRSNAGEIAAFDLRK